MGAIGWFGEARRAQKRTCDGPCLDAAIIEDDDPGQRHLKYPAKPARIAGCSNQLSGNSVEADHFIEIANTVDKGAWRETTGN